MPQCNKRLDPRRTKGWSVAGLGVLAGRVGCGYFLDRFFGPHTAAVVGVLAAAVMARLHSMNLSTWKADPFMLASHGRRTLEDLEGELKAISVRPDFPGGPCVMAQVCIERL